MCVFFIFVADHLLGRAVRRIEDGLGRVAVDVCGEVGGPAQIHQQNAARFAGNQNVLRLDVPVHNLVRVHGRRRREERPGEPQEHQRARFVSSALFGCGFRIGVAAKDAADRVKRLLGAPRARHARLERFDADVSPD